MHRDILILGGSGYVGQALMQALGKERVIGTQYAADVPGMLVFDARSETYAQLNIRDNPPRYVIILFAESQIENCFRDQYFAFELNVTATIRIVDELMDAGVIPLFVSTDLVFDGEKGDYTELDHPEPILEYGRQKLAVERHLEDAGQPYLVVRLPKIVSTNITPRCVFGDWLDAILRGREIRCSDDQFFSPIDVEDAAAGIVGLIDQNLLGLFHIGGPDRWCRADLFDALACEVRRYKDVSTQMRRCSIRSFPEFSEIRPFDTSLQSDKSAKLLGLKYRSMEEVCAKAIQRVFDS
jgi:dTDP-4-dehydrorhamnose reductase